MRIAPVAAGNRPNREWRKAAKAPSDEPLVFHTGARGLFALVSEAIAKVLPLASIRYVAFSHFEADECGALNPFLAAAPRAVPVASQVGAMVSVNAFADRPALAMADGEVLRTGRRAFK
jgi:flavorubredoxin